MYQFISIAHQRYFYFNLNKIQLKWFDKKLPATSEFKNKKWITKQVAEININQSIKTIIWKQ